MFASLLVVAVAISQGGVGYPGQESPGSSDLESRVSSLEKENRELRDRIDRVERLCRALADRKSSIGSFSGLMPGDSTKRDDFSPMTRTWTITGRPVVADFNGFTGGEATLITEDGASITVKSSEMSASDREWIKDEMRARKDIEDKLATGAWRKCPGRGCVRGKIYGSSSTSVASPTGSLSFTGRVPTGSCPVCGGRGVVPNR